MWSLWKHNSDEIFFKLLCDAQYKVGRKDAAIVIANDQSISRQHALLSTSAVPCERIDVTAKPLLRLKDLGSKYGTTVNNRRLGKDEENVLQQGDVLTFGQLGSTFEVRYEEPMVVVSSCLKPDRRGELKEQLTKLGARVAQEWTPNCTHLVMDAIKLTIKTACALLAVKPIVTPSFFKDTVTRVQDGHWQQLNTSDYIPCVREESLRIEKQGFDRNPARQTLFRGKFFYFFNKDQYKKLHLALASGGAKVELVEDGGEPKDAYASAQACVVRPPEGANHPVAKFLVQKGLRVIPESDIGMAVAYCSTEKFCNPESTVAANFWQNTTMESECPTQDDVYAAETEPSQGILPTRSTSMTARTILETRPSTVNTTLDGRACESTAGETTLRSPSSLARDKSPFTVTKGGSPIKLSSGVGAPVSPSKGNGKSSPTKARKKDARGTLPLQFYFQPNKRQNEDANVDCPAEKVARLLLDDEPDEVEVKREVVTPPPENEVLHVEMADTSPVRPVPVETSPENTSESADKGIRSPSKVPKVPHVVVMEPLICKRPPVVPRETSDGPNFKRFRKFQPLNTNQLPIIIRMTTATITPSRGKTDFEDEPDDNPFFDAALLPKRRRLH